MPNIKKTRENILISPTKVELLEAIGNQLYENNYPKELHVIVGPGYSSRLKKLVPLLLGYRTKGLKLGESFTIYRID